MGFLEYRQEAPVLFCQSFLRTTQVIAEKNQRTLHTKRRTTYLLEQKDETKNKRGSSDRPYFQVAAINLLY
jgi:hypothetical protein